MWSATAKSTIEELIEITNQDPRRGEGHDNLLTRIEVDRTTWQLLDRKGYTLDTVLPRGEVCYLRATANLSTGGIAIDRTDDIHPTNLWIAERIAKIIGLDIARYRHRYHRHLQAPAGNRQRCGRS